MLADCGGAQARDVTRRGPYGAHAQRRFTLHALVIYMETSRFNYYVIIYNMKAEDINYYFDSLNALNLEESRNVQISFLN